MKKMTTKRRRRIGSSAALLLALVLPLFAAYKNKSAGPQAAIAGTVFRDPGFAFPGVDVTLVSLPGPDSHDKPAKHKAVTTPRGEFLFHVPAVESHFRVSVAAKGYAPQQKDVEIRGEERVDLSFLLEPESK
jgi:hypothetical protein